MPDGFCKTMRSLPRSGNPTSAPQFTQPTTHTRRTRRPHARAQSAMCQFHRRPCGTRHPHNSALRARARAPRSPLHASHAAGLENSLGSRPHAWPMRGCMHTRLPKGCCATHSARFRLSRSVCHCSPTRRPSCSWSQYWASKHGPPPAIWPPSCDSKPSGRRQAPTRSQYAPPPVCCPCPYAPPPAQPVSPYFSPAANM